MRFLKNNKLLVTILVIALVGFFTYSYLYKPHKNIALSKASYTGTTVDFEKSVQNNATIWLDKTVVIKGTITQVDKNGITLDNKVYCQFNELESELKSTQKQITIKGRVIGYDDLLEEVKLDQCTFQK